LQPPTEGERDDWLERLLDACDRVSASLTELNDPQVRGLADDVDQLRARLRTELGRDESA
jgi:hypothetical protein